MDAKKQKWKLLGNNRKKYPCKGMRFRIHFERPKSLNSTYLEIHNCGRWNLADNYKSRGRPTAGRSFLHCCCTGSGDIGRTIRWIHRGSIQVHIPAMEHRYKSSEFIELQLKFTKTPKDGADTPNSLVCQTQTLPELPVSLDHEIWLKRNK